MSRPMANLLLLLAGAIWGMGFVAQSTAMDAIGPFLFIGLRFLVASIVVAPFAIHEMRTATTPVSRSSRRGFVAIGVTLFVGMALQQVGLLTTSVTNSGFLTGLYVIFTPVITLLVLRLKPHVLVWPAVLLAVGREACTRDLGMEEAGVDYDPKSGGWSPSPGKELCFCCCYKKL